MAATQMDRGVLHRIQRSFSSSPTDAQFVAFEYSKTTSEPRHTLIFLGGLFDSLGTVTYVPKLAASLPPDWRLVEPVLGSSARQWGISTLNDDVKEIADLVAHFRGASTNSKIVLLGHSTGCQDIMHYLLSPDPGNAPARPKLDGAILQACVSDREAIIKLTTSEQYKELCDISQEYVNDGKGDEIVPLRYSRHIFNGAAPISAQRMISIVSPPPNHNGEDDYFSSDLGDERFRATFGQIGRTGVRIALVYGERDEFVPRHVDKTELVGRWNSIMREGGALVDETSGILPNARHAIKNEDALADFTGRVHAFLGRV